MEISAKTKVFAVLGDPIAHTLSPMIQNHAAALRGIDMAYHAFHVVPDDLENAVKGGAALGISGFNITVPHKKSVMAYLCGINEDARAIGAVNTLKLTENGYVGYNTDVIGAYYALETNGIEIQGRTVVILGAGGAGNACAAMAVSRGAKRVLILNRTLATAAQLAARLNEHYGAYGCEICAGDIISVNDTEKADIVINCTTLGFGGRADMSPVNDVKWYEKAGVSAVFDAVYSPWETRLLREAQQAGIKTVNGFPMLVYQALAAQEIWFDIEYTAQERRGICDELTEKYLSLKR